MSYIYEDLPPILTIHGDNDQVVPYSHARQLHRALDMVGAPNELVALEGREHFIDHSPADNRQAYEAIDRFLEKFVD